MTLLWIKWRNIPQIRWYRLRNVDRKLDFFSLRVQWSWEQREGWKFFACRMCSITILVWSCWCWRKTKKTTKNQQITQLLISIFLIIKVISRFINKSPRIIGVHVKMWFKLNHYNTYNNLTCENIIKSYLQVLVTIEPLVKNGWPVNFFPHMSVLFIKTL